MAQPNGRFTDIRKVNGGLVDFSSGSAVFDGVIVSGSGAQLDQTITLRDGGTIVAKDLAVGVVHELAIAQVSSSAATLGTVYVLKRNG